MTVLEHIKQLSNSLTPKQREELAKYLQRQHRPSPPKKPLNLRGRWKIGLPDDFDLDTVLTEVRSEWKKELDFDL